MATSDFGRPPSARPTTASAPGKVILLGEHAVVYGRPALAVPVQQAQATATVTDRPPGAGALLSLPDLGQTIPLAAAPADHPLAVAIRATIAHLRWPHPPDWHIEVRSQIPIASGMGSGAAVSTAAVRALLRHAGQEPLPRTVSAIVYRSEEIHHGTPSGIDNTVIAYGQPVWFVKGRELETVMVARPFTLIIADSGIASPTRETVAAVRRGRQAHPQAYESRFDEIGRLVARARRSLELGAVAALGPLMDRNQLLLEELQVSSERLQVLIAAARAAGATGAKLSGGGRGGNVIALVTPATVNAVAEALLAAGARQVIRTTVEKSQH